MSHAAAFHSGLTDDEWSRRERVFRRFENAWLAGPRPLIDEFLPEDPGERQAVLVELVHADLEYRLKVGEPARVEEYLARYPELGSDLEAELGLIEAELELRRRREQDLTLDEFLARFPRHREELLSTRRGWPRPGSPRLLCPRCGAAIEAPADATRVRFDCPACEATFRLAPSDPFPWPSGRPPRLGKYELIEEVGRGQFGIVYRARDAELGRDVAVKVARAGWLASPAEVDWFFREARSVAVLAHPHIVPVFDSGREGETCYIVCAFVPGTTLADRLASGRLLPQEAAEMAAGAADALDHAHRRGVVHRDVKPSNILLDLDGRPHLTDFGLARREAGEVTVTIDGVLLGTPAYTSPEQARGEAHGVDGRSDVYSLGVVLYEMLTGERPFQGKGEALILQVLEDEPRPPRRLNDRLPRDLETVCLKCLRKEPRDRYASAAALADDLRRFLDGLPVRARPVGRPERFARWCRRNPVVAGSLTAFALAVVVGLALVTWQWQQARKERARAEENFRVAWDAVNEFLVLVSQNADLRRDLPGLQKFRADLLGKALAYYQDFLRQHGQDRNLRDMVATAYYQVAKVTADIGSKQDALAASRQGLAIREELVRIDPAVAKYRLNLAETHRQLGYLEEVLGRFPDAEQSLNKAHQLFDELATARPGQPEFQDKAASTLSSIADIQNQTGRLPDAERTYIRAREIQGRLVAAHPEAVSYRNALARTKTSLGRLLQRSGRHAEAENSLVEAREILTGLADADPDNTDYRMELARAHTVLGYLFIVSRRPLDAERSVIRAREIRTKLAAAHPDVTSYQNGLAGDWMNLGILQNQAGRRTEAEESFRSARKIQAKLVAAHPEDVGFSKDLAGTDMNLGDLQYTLGHRSDAEQNYLEARDLFRKLVEITPNSTAFRVGLAKTLHHLGVVQAATDRPTEAERSYIQSRDVLQRLLKAKPGQPEWQAELGATLKEYGELLARSGRKQEALEVARQAIHHGRLACKAAPGDGLIRSLLSLSYRALAWIERDLDHPAEAADAVLEDRKLWPDRPDELARVAGDLALCIPLVGKGQAGLTPGERARRGEYADLAIETLRRAVGAGFKDLARLEKDPDFDPLRPRADFRSLIMDLAFPADPFAR